MKRRSHFFVLLPRTAVWVWAIIVVILLESEGVPNNVPKKEKKKTKAIGIWDKGSLCFGGITTEVSDIS